MSEKEKKNKSWEPEEQKDKGAEVPNVQMVTIKFRPNRRAEGVDMDANGMASVSAALAAYLVGIQYADYV